MARATKRADGRLVKKIVDPATGKPKYFYGKTMREINEKIMEYTAAAEIGRPFREVAEEWWEIASVDFKLQTLKPYRPAFKRVIEEFEEKPIKSIKPRDVSVFLGKLARDGMAYKTVANHKTILNKIFKHAILEGDVELNPCSSIDMPKGLAKEKRKSASHADEGKIRDDEGAWLVHVIALYAGLRKGEILALQWQDVNLDEDLIYVTKSVAHDGNRPVITTPKTEAGFRVVPIVPELKERLLAEPDRSPERYVVSDTGDTPLTNKRYETLSRQARKRTGITCTAHNLRHSFATNAFEADLNAKSVQEIIGHKQISTTLNTYTDFRMESVKKAAEILSKKSPKTPQK